MGHMFNAHSQVNLKGCDYSHAKSSSSSLRPGLLRRSFTFSSNSSDTRRAGARRGDGSTSTCKDSSERQISNYLPVKRNRWPRERPSSNTTTHRDVTGQLSPASHASRAWMVSRYRASMCVQVVLSAVMALTRIQVISVSIDAAGLPVMLVGLRPVVLMTDVIPALLWLAPCLQMADRWRMSVHLDRVRITVVVACLSATQQLPFRDVVLTYWPWHSRLWELARVCHE